MKIARQNPLSIIAIFAGLAEVAGTVMITYLTEDLQSIFIWFVMLFPVILVSLFFYVLYRKPLNFYSPEYYKDEENFITAMRLRDEIVSMYNKVVDKADIPEEVKEELDSEIFKIEKKYETINKDNKVPETILSLKLNGNSIDATSVKDFYRKIFDFLKKEDIKYDDRVPYETGTKRYLINYENKHIYGNSFFAPIKIGKYYIETHKSKIGARKDIVKFLEELGIDVE